MSRSHRPVLGNVNGGRLIASELPLRSTVIIIERVVFLIILAGVSAMSLSIDFNAIVTYKFNPRSVFRRPMRGLVLRQRVAADRFEASRPLIERLAAAL